MKRHSSGPKVFDSTGEEVLITMICQHCGKTKPLKAFGLRTMPSGTIRNQPWCTECRSYPTRRQAR